MMCPLRSLLNRVNGLADLSRANNSFTIMLLIYAPCRKGGEAFSQFEVFRLTHSHRVLSLNKHTQTSVLDQLYLNI